MLMDSTTVNPDVEQMMLTTIDNPYNPKTDYDNWRRWDLEKGYHTESYLDRMMDIPPEVDVDDEITISLIAQRAMHEIVEHDMMRIYKIIF